MNRWLSRVMRLGNGNGRVMSGSSGYGAHALGASLAPMGAAPRNRRKSAVEINYLKPPAAARGRRFSDSINLNPGSHWTFGSGSGAPGFRIGSRSRKGEKNY